jgi:hypothetical protein
MGRRKKTGKHSRAKTILRLPDLEQSRNAVLNSLAAASSQESYAHAIDEFIGWYCSASFVIDSFSNRRTWHLRQSTYA